jgi:DNA-directed RNA polymerase subunit B"
MPVDDLIKSPGYQDITDDSGKNPLGKEGVILGD